MSMTFQPDLDFEAASQAAEDGEALIIDIDGYEGPLHLLLALARTQKVDLLKLSITSLVDQYLAFVREARRRRFSLAADYLVMAAWLAFLKSRLLLPKAQKGTEDAEPAEDMASHLAFRLAKLDAMRTAGGELDRTRGLRGEYRDSGGWPHAHLHPRSRGPLLRWTLDTRRRAVARARSRRRWTRSALG